MNARSLLFSLAMLALVLSALLVFDRPSRAGDEQGHSIVFLNITGEGPTAKAWYRGAPPAGLPVQDALDKFSSEGFRVATVSPSQRPIVQAIVSDGGRLDEPRDVEQFFIVLLERP